MEGAEEEAEEEGTGIEEEGVVGVMDTDTGIEEEEEEEEEEMVEEEGTTIIAERRRTVSRTSILGTQTERRAISGHSDVL